MESLTAYGEEFFIPEIFDGQDVPVGGGYGGTYYLRCDFSAFAEKLKNLTPEELERRFVNDGEFKKQFPEMSESERKLLYVCWVAGKITRNILGNVANETIRNDSFAARYRTKTENGTPVCVKPLSGCRDESVCSEYALMSHHILKKLGVRSAVVIGAFNENIADELVDRHTFLVLDNGQYVFDPTHTADQELCWPPKVFVAESPLTAETLKDTTKTLDDSFGVKIVCTDLVNKEQKLYGSGA